MSSCMIYSPHQMNNYYSGDQINKNEIGGTFNTYVQKMGV